MQLSPPPPPQNDSVKFPASVLLHTPPAVNAAPAALNNPVLSASFCHTQNARYRPSMEDASKVVSNFLDSPGSGYYAVFDGHAGSFSAKWCAANIYKLLAQNLTLFATQYSVPTILAFTFDQAHNRLCSLQDYDQSGCTAAIAYIKSHHPLNHITAPTAYTRRRQHSFSGVPSFKQSSQRVLYTANVGDSRIILCSSGIAKRLTYDHRASDKAETSRIKNNGGKVLVGRVDGSLAVSRALGDYRFTPYVSSRPYTTELELDDQDEFLIIACDGVWDVCSDQAAVDLVRDIEEPLEAAQKLVRHALFLGSTDNVTCMVVRLKGAIHDDSLKSESCRAAEKVVKVLDTVTLTENDLPSRKIAIPELPRNPAAPPQFDVLPGSPTESDTTVSEDEEDSLEDTADVISYTGANMAEKPKDYLHKRASSFSPSIFRRKSHNEYQEDSEESSLDRYGRFKRIVRLEYDFEGDDCAIADSD